MLRSLPLNLEPQIRSLIILNLKTGSRGFLTDLIDGGKDLFRRVDDVGTDVAKDKLRKIDRGARWGFNEINRVVKTVVGRGFWGVWRLNEYQR